MATFLFNGVYASGALNQVSAERTARAKAIIEGLGGRLVAGYATLGAADIVLVLDLPSVDTAVQASVALSKTLGIRFTTEPAVSLEEFDKIAS